MKQSIYYLILFFGLLCVACSLKTNARQECTEVYASMTAEEEVEGNEAVEADPIESVAIELPRTNAGIEEQQIQHVGYRTSWNPMWLIPNWVAYDLTLEEAEGTEPRPKRQFEPDPLVEGVSSTHRDYTNSGYCRGHMVPAADMKWSKEAMNECFYLSNICPQVAELNDGVWKRLENRVRALASEATVYICCGPVVAQEPGRIGDNGVAVPVQFFKVLCMQRKGRWQTIAFLCPNEPCKGSMFDYALSVDELEALLDMDFFYNLPDSIENTIEASWKMKHWQ